MANRKEKRIHTDWRIVCFGLACLTIVELYLISLGKNGTFLMIYTGLVAGVLGLQFQNPLITK